MKLKFFTLIILIIACIGLISCDVENDVIPDDSSASQSEHVHIYTKTTIAPTCTAQGYTIKSCSCGYSENVDYVNATGHDDGEWTTTLEPTCSEMGKMQKHCTICDSLIDSKSTEKVAHTYLDVKTMPTCQAEGNTKHTCQVCGYSYTDKYEAKTEHKAGAPIVTINSTCKKNGEREYHCTYCNEFIRKEQTDILSCSYVSYSVEANGTEPAHTLYVCTSCGDSYKGPYVSAGTATQTTAKEVYNSVKGAIVEIAAFDRARNRVGMGTGFFVSADGYIATNYHVVEGAYSLAVTRYAGGGAITSVKLVAYNISQDVAILKIETSGEQFLKLASNTVETGDTVYAIGSSLGLTDTFTQGIISNVDRYISGINCIQFTAPVSGGNSGGPLINVNGEVVGIVTLAINDAQNLNFAVKASTVESVIAEKLDTPLTISEYYAQALELHAMTVLKYYIMSNCTVAKDNEYYIFAYEPQTATSYAREYYYSYDIERDLVYIKIEIIVNGMNRLRITLELAGYDEKMFGITMYDYEYSQATILGYLDHTVDLNIMSAVYNDTYFNSVFSDVESKYTDDPTTEKNEPQIMKQMLYQSYSSLIVKFANQLIDSQTGLSIDMFNISVPK